MKSRIGLKIALGLALMLPPATLMLAQQAGAGRGGSVARSEGPCDIYAAGGTPCVAAHSTTRALSASYNGPLYQVLRQSDGKMLDIGVLRGSEDGGYADAAAQDAFCANTLCFITKLYDQSGKGNDLLQAPPGPSFQGPAKGGFDTLPIADMAPITINGHKAYGVFIMPGMGFRNNNAIGLAINDEPEGMYSVFDGTHFDSGCCFDYGNAETDSRADGPGTMENTYFGTSTTWGSGNGNGPWIMADMEGGVFSGYNARKNDVPSINSWRFVTAFVNGGGGNKWDLRGADAQKGAVTTYYSGPRPGSRENSNYFPMHKQGAILMGTGGDNGNGSSGTYYEGVMTSGYPTDAAVNAVQANVVAVKYDVQRVSLSRATTFTPGSSQEVIETFTNTTGTPATGVILSITVPAMAGWTATVAGSTDTAIAFGDPVAPGASVSWTFKVTPSATTGAGFLTGKAQWANAGQAPQTETASTRVRNAFPIKINEVQLGSGQFIELYNAGASEVDLSTWSLLNTQSQWATVKLATIPAGTKLAAKQFYLLGQSSSGLVTAAAKGDAAINVRSVDGFTAGQQIDIEGESHKIANVGTAAAAMTTVFVPVTTGPWLTIPAGSTNLPVSNATGFAVGEKIGIDIGGNYEVATVTTVGKAATQTTLAAAATAGATSIRVAGGANMTVGDTLTLGAGSRKELVQIKSISAPAPVANGAAAAAPGAGGGRGRGGRGGGVPAEIELAAPLKVDHQSGVDVSDVGTGITFSPATKFPHVSGDAVQALGGGITLDGPLMNGHPYGAAVVNSQATTAGYQGPQPPSQWFGGALSARAGSIALLDATGALVVDAIVYGSQQSNSSGNGTITSPELATLEGDQRQGGCIAVVPGAGGGRGRGAAAAGGPSRSVARISDGADADSNCADFQMQASTPGAPNQKNP